MARRPAERKGVDYYLELPYGIELRPYEDGTWFARVVELPGCMTEADTLEEVMGMIRDAQRVWVRAALETGAPIPEPQFIPAFSELRVRLPARPRHRLTKQAAEEGTDLSGLVLSLLSRAVGEPKQERPAPPRPARRKMPTPAKAR
jgi:antitoxin HicB